MRHAKHKLASTQRHVSRSELCLQPGMLLTEKGPHCSKVSSAGNCSWATTMLKAVCTALEMTPCSRICIRAAARLTSSACHHSPSHLPQLKKFTKTLPLWRKFAPGSMAKPSPSV